MRPLKCIALLWQSLPKPSRGFSCISSPNALAFTEADHGSTNVYRDRHHTFSFPAVTPLYYAKPCVFSYFVWMYPTPFLPFTVGHSSSSVQSFIGNFQFTTTWYCDDKEAAVSFGSQRQRFGNIVIDRPDHPQKLIVTWWVEFQFNRFKKNTRQRRPERIS